MHQVEARETAKSYDAAVGGIRSADAMVEWTLAVLQAVTAAKVV